jgi:molybdopterin molybdotransferase
VTASVSPVPYDEALQIVLTNVPRLPVVEVELAAAVGCVLAEDIVCDVDMPPFDKSAMDGYAVRAADITTAPVELCVVEIIPAGRAPTRAIGSGECAKIMTGAPVPQGADTVVMVEETEPVGEDRVSIQQAVQAGSNICLRGEDVREGQTVVTAGTVLRPFDIALAASSGRTPVPVYATPRVAIIATGDEVVEPDRSPEMGQIRNSNSHAVAARLRHAGIAAAYLGIARDDADATTRLLRDGLTRDALIISGGVSMGDYDLVPGLLKNLGVELLFEKIAVKPGKPTVFGRGGSTAVFGLPGNPVSTLVITELLLMPALRRMMGEQDPAPTMVDAVLDAAISHTPKRMSFRPVMLRRSEGAWHAKPVRYNGSADLAGAARGDGFAEIPQGVKELPAGAGVRVLLVTPGDPGFGGRR